MDSVLAAPANPMATRFALLMCAYGKKEAGDKPRP